MADPKFPYRTIIDRVITDEKGNILFGENPANVQDSLNNDNQKIMIGKLETMVNNQQAKINRLDTMLSKQDEQIAHQQEQLNNQSDMIAKQAVVIERLQDIITEAEENTGAVQTVNNSVMGLRTDATDIITELQKTFDVVINGNTMELFGESVQPKPSNVEIGTTFFEMDTGKVFMFTGNMWVEL